MPVRPARDDRAVPDRGDIRPLTVPRPEPDPECGARGATEEARLFALVNVAGADALISCWDDKAHWSFWRPSMAIRAASTDGNPATEEDGSWTPLIGNPPYPDHPSGYNCGTGSMLGAAKTFFRTNQVQFTAVSDAPNVVDRTRDYARLCDACHDTIDARIYLGIHFRTPDVQAVVMGRKVAHWVAKHYFQPIR